MGRQIRGTNRGHASGSNLGGTIRGHASPSNLGGTIRGHASASNLGGTIRGRSGAPSSATSRSDPETVTLNFPFFSHKEFYGARFRGELSQQRRKHVRGHGQRIRGHG